MNIYHRIYFIQYIKYIYYNKNQIYLLTYKNTVRHLLRTYMKVNLIAHNIYYVINTIMSYYKTYISLQRSTIPFIFGCPSKRR